MNRIIYISIACIVILGGILFYANNKKEVPLVATPQTPTTLTYTDTTYGFALTLPHDWSGYTFVPTTVQFGQAITLRHPLWTKEKPYMDIPILIYPIAQWTTWEKNNFEGYPTAAPIGPTERGRNARYVFATAPRYNYSFGTGFETVEEIIKNLKAF